MIKRLSASSTQGAADFPYFKIVEIKKLPERERQHFNLHAPTREIGGILGGQQVGVGAGNVDVAVQIHPEGIDRIFPGVDALQLVKEEVHPLARNGFLFYIVVYLI